MHVLGIHHVTAVTAKASENLHFYTQVLGMRLVKKTVNQDDVRAYHLFYADAKGSPGTDLTFFDWADSPRAVRGNRSISQTGLQVGSLTALEWWADRFAKLGVAHRQIVERDGRPELEFEDSEGQPLKLVVSDGPGNVWERSPIPSEHQIKGLGPSAITVPSIDGTGEILTEALGMKQTGKYQESEPASESRTRSSTFTTFVYQMDRPGAGAELHVRVRPDLPLHRPGAGGVHHIAFRVGDEEAYNSWADRLNRLRIPNSGKVNRYYFQSLYFREPNGILFELATDGPGFASDESLDEMGSRLALPPFLEERRKEIERNLKPL